MGYRKKFITRELTGLIHHSIFNHLDGIQIIKPHAQFTRHIVEQRRVYYEVELLDRAGHQINGTVILYFYFEGTELKYRIDSITATKKHGTAVNRIINKIETCFQISKHAIGPLILELIVSKVLRYRQKLLIQYV